MIVGIIQCRMASTRLPGKALADIQGLPLIARVLLRAQRIAGVDQVWLATSQSPENDPLENLCQQMGFPCLRGGEDDVIGRFAQVAQKTHATQILRLTGDNPLLDPWAIGALLKNHIHNQADYSCLSGLPVGASCDIFSRRALLETHSSVDGNKMADHLDLHILENQQRYAVQAFQVLPSFSSLRLTIDHPQDLAQVQNLFALGKSQKNLDIDTLNSQEIFAMVQELQLAESMRNQETLVSKENLYTAELVAQIQQRFTLDYATLVARENP